MPRSTDTTSPPNHQTVRLGRGAHRSPEHGACVMELASMLAGERFSDNEAALAFADRLVEIGSGPTEPAVAEAVAARTRGSALRPLKGQTG